MAATRALTVCDTYDRFVKGKKVDEAEWDYTIIPQNATELKNKYKLRIEYIISKRNLITSDSSCLWLLRSQNAFYNQLNCIFFLNLRFNFDLVCCIKTKFAICGFDCNKTTINSCNFCL